MTVSTINAVVVLHAFGSYNKGQVLTDQTVIAAILSGGNAAMVIRTQVPGVPSSTVSNAEEH